MFLWLNNYNNYFLIFIRVKFLVIPVIHRLLGNLLG